MEHVDPAVARWAVDDVGLAVIAEAVDALATGASSLAVGTRLRRTLDADRAAFAVAAAEARRRAVAAGVPGAERLVLTREAGEQASAPVVAAWRAAQVGAALAVRGPTSVVDLCAGTGGDAVALAVHGPVTAVERDPGRAVLAAHRAAVLDVPVTVVVGDAVAPPVTLDAALVHADPDRRDAGGRRARTLAQHSPSVPALLTAAAAAAGTMLTVAPGMAWDDPDRPADHEVTFLQVGTKLVEAVLAGGALAEPGVVARAVLLPQGETVVRTSDDHDRLPVGPVGSHLLLPAPAAVRARAHDLLGHGAGVSVRRVADHRSLLTADLAVSSPWWRCEVVLDVLPLRAKVVRAWLREHEGRRVEVLTHGVDTDVSAFHRALGRPPTGPDDVRVHLVRRDRDAVVVITEPTAHDAP